MRIECLVGQRYEIPMRRGKKRSGILIKLTTEEGTGAWGEIAPLPGWSRETLEAASSQLEQKAANIRTIDWDLKNCLKELEALRLLPSLHFGLESALLTLLDPLPSFSVQASALLMGSLDEIFDQADARQSEGFASAKLKVGNLSFDEAYEAISRLAGRFRLRIDVNRGWETEDSLRFFEQFPLDSFDYVEEPFCDPHALARFPHPLAVDESVPEALTLEDLEKFPTLKALIYKPTMQGGVSGCLKLQEWARHRGIGIIFSSSFESDLGLAQVALAARRLGNDIPIGIGTFHHMQEQLCSTVLHFERGSAKITLPIQPDPRS